MKKLVVNTVGFLLRLVFPDRWVNEDTIGAVVGIIVVTLGASLVAMFLSGCYGGSVYLKPYHHNSSIPENGDANTSDRGGVCEMHYLGPQKHAPTMHVCIDAEYTKKPVFGHKESGRDIVGDVQIHVPLYTWGNR